MPKDVTNETLGITAQVVICQLAKIDVPPQFEKRANNALAESLRPVLTIILEKIPSRPLLFKTSEQIQQKANKRTYVNFELRNGKTLSIRTNLKGSKQAANVVGQPGDETFTRHFGHLFSAPISKEVFKNLVIAEAQKMLPIYLDFLFLSDFTIWLYKKDGAFRAEILERADIPEYNWNAEDFSFTKTLDQWVESNTLKYQGVSLGEFQVHKNRTGYKFRFHLEKLLQLLRSMQDKTETLGATAEKCICEIFKLHYPSNLRNRYNPTLETKLLPVLKKAFEQLPKPAKYVGAELDAERKGKKSEVDFYLKDGLSLSVKTNWGKMVCPPEVGQPSKNTFLKYFGDLIPGEFSDKKFKEAALTKTGVMMARYLQYLFGCDYLLWIYHVSKNNSFEAKVVRKKDVAHVVWDQAAFSFSQAVDTWNESCSVSYKGVPLGAFQIHNHRNCYKFRFNMPGLLRLLEDLSK